MTQYIPKAAVVAEIKKRSKEWKYGSSIEAKYKREECDDIHSFIEALEVKEVDLDFEQELYKAFGQVKDFILGMRIAKHFFELGVSTNHPNTASDRGMAEEIIVNLKRVENDYRIDLTKEIGWLRNISACK